MDISPFFFYLFAGIAIAFSLLVLLQKNPVSNAFSLVMVFFAFAGIYASLDAHLIAALQVLVYAGAIMVLFLFVIMLLNADSPSFDLGRSHIALRVSSLIAVVLLFGIFVWVFKESPSRAPVGTFTAANIEQAGGNTRVLSELLFSEYILPFELTSVLLLCGIVATLALAKRNKPKAVGHQSLSQTSSTLKGSKA